MPDRELCDLGHRVTQSTKVGRLTTLARVPVLPGDSHNVTSNIFVRLNPLRRPLAIDFKCDVFAFFVPYRYTYGDDWIRYIEEGPTSTVTFPTVATTGSSIQDWLCCNQVPTPKHIIADANNIYNQWFRDPALPELAETALPPGDERYFGIKIGALKGWGTAQAGNADATDTQFNIDSSGATINFFDVVSQASKARQKQIRDYVSSRYTEILQSATDKPVDVKVDNKPELIWQDSMWLSGHDLNGTANAQFGASVGKGVGAMKFGFPDRYFEEHGTVYIMGALRCPSIFVEQIQYLDNFNARSWDELNPSGAQHFPPKDLKFSDLFRGGDNTSAGFIPFYNWYRSHPHFVNRQFQGNWGDSGWPFLYPPSTYEQLVECGDYDQAFAGSAAILGHATWSVEHNWNAWRILPDALDSIMGGGI